MQNSKLSNIVFTFEPLSYITVYELVLHACLHHTVSLFSQTSHHSKHRQLRCRICCLIFCYSEIVKISTYKFVDTLSLLKLQVVCYRLQSEIQFCQYLQSSELRFYFLYSVVDGTHLWYLILRQLLCSPILQELRGRAIPSIRFELLLFNRWLKVCVWSG